MQKKRLIIFLFLFPLFAQNMMAQVGERRNDLAIGLNGGVALSSVDFDPTIKQNQHIGMAGGLVLRYTCEKYFKTLCALQVELNLTQMGWKENILNRAGQELPDTYERTLTYLTIPLLARLSWGKEQRGVQFFLNAGPQIGFNIGDKAQKSATWTTLEDGQPDRPNNVSEQYDMGLDHKLDYGIAAGLGLEANTPIGYFQLEGRYYFGLGDFYGNSKKDVFSRSANRVIEIKLSYLYSILKER